MLLFIVMGIDEKRHRVPLAFMMFSAPSGNQQTSSGYDTKILEKLIRHWKDSLGTCNNQEFAPSLAITDTNLKEQGALLRVFPALWLLICRFHLRQVWRNHCSRFLKGLSKIHVDLSGQMQLLEVTLLQTTAHVEATALINDERHLLAEAVKSDLDPTEHGPVNGTFAHMDYLVGYWLSESSTLRLAFPLSQCRPRSVRLLLLVQSSGRQCL